MNKQNFLLPQKQNGLLRHNHDKFLNATCTCNWYVTKREKAFAILNAEERILELTSGHEGVGDGLVACSVLNPDCLQPRKFETIFNHRKKNYGVTNCCYWQQ